MTPASDWPSPVEIRNAGGASDIVLLCEHASNHIPGEYRGLGLKPEDLARHIAWDIGAAEVTRRLSDLLGAPAVLAGYSRLLIDLNRPLDAPSSIVARSEATDIPGNVALSDEERSRRARLMFAPFHDQVSAWLDDRQTQGRPVRLVSIHSFTPVYHGVQRHLHGGVLFDRAQDLGEALVSRLNTPDLTVLANQPYQSSRTEDYAVPVHGDDRGIPAVLIEIRNDLISSPQGVEEWALRLADAL